MTTRVVEAPARPLSWGEVVLAVAAGFAWGFAVGLAVACAVWPGTAFAGGPVALTWNQATDCGSVTGWELLVAPITTANPNPQASTAPVGVSFANNVPPCGLNMTRTVTMSGVGQHRFWLRAVAGAIKSDVSNAVDRSLSLGKPDGLTVVEP